MHNVLIVDEEEHLLSALEQNLFPDRDDIAILTATDGEQGLEHLKNSRIDLLISDIKMPGKIDGFQLILRAKEVAPAARVIIITAFGSNRVQNFAAKIGITHYIEKPFNTSELREAILEILDERTGFQGVLSDLELTDIIQMLCLARRTALLHLKHRDHRGRIVFDNGDVVHAEFDDEAGVDAVYRMLALRQGDIFMQGDFQNDRKTIDIGWQDLLLEGVRRADEGRADLDDESESEDDGPGTDVGMGISSGEIEDIIADATMEQDAMTAESFFSDDELREIEAANIGDDSMGDPLPFATLEADSEAPRIGREASVVSDDVEFQSPFRRESTSPPGPFSPVAPAFSADEFPFDALHSRLEQFARECPGLRQTAVISSEEGISLSSAEPDPVLDHDAFAALCGEIVSAAQRSIEALGPEEFRELQVASGDHYILLCHVPNTPYHHLAVVTRGVSLGVAMVLMRRVQRGMRNDLEKG